LTQNYIVTDGQRDTLRQQMMKFIHHRDRTQKFTVTDKETD